MGCCNINDSRLWRCLSYNWLGKLLSGFIALLGIGLVALPTGIISSGFIEELGNNKKKDKNIICPHCGRKID